MRTGACVYEAPPDVLEQLKQHPDVRMAELDITYRAFTPVTATANDPYYAYQYGLEKIQAPDAWNITQGKESVLIAIVDTGIQYDHPDLAGKVIRGFDFVDGDWNPYDQEGHGTHCAGIAGAYINNSQGVAGVAPGCTLYSVRVLNMDGIGFVSDIADGIVHAADVGCKVISLSLGGPWHSEMVKYAVDYAWAKGAVVIAAAGNEGTTDPHYPAYYENCIAVAATDRNDDLADFSQRGTWVDVAAPGVDILSTYMPSRYNYLSGTSMACPHVSGLAGLLVSMGKTNTDVRAAIESTCDPIPGTGTDFKHGRINAAAIASFLFGGWDLSLTALALMMAFDYATGFLAAAKEGKLNSNVGFWGIVRKAGTFIVVSAVYWMALNALPDAKQAIAVRDGVAIAFFFTEGVSVIENCGRLGVKIHPIVRQAVDQLRQKGEEKNGGQNLS